MRTDHDWLEDGCLECGKVPFRESSLLSVCVDCFHEETQHTGPLVLTPSWEHEEID